MEGILKVSPEQLTSAASEFSAYGTTVRNITSEMTSIVTSLSSAWGWRRTPPLTSQNSTVFKTILRESTP